MAHKANRPRRHKIPMARYRVENWAVGFVMKTGPARNML
ncbi:hypothetical protein [Azospirillum endophyticum]